MTGGLPSHKTAMPPPTASYKTPLALGTAAISSVRSTMAAFYALEPAWCSTTPRRSWRALSSPSAGGLKSVSSALDVLECFAVDRELGVLDRSYGRFEG